MAFKTILVPLDGSGVNPTVLEAALAAARRFAAHIEVLYARPDPRHTLPLATLGLSSSMKQNVIEAATRSVDQAAGQARAVFEDFCRRSELAIVARPPGPGKASAAWREETGHPSEVLVRRGRLVDLIFVARPTQPSPPPAMLETALLETGQPVVLVPPKSYNCIASRITIGWNASAEAARAVSEAMPCLTGAESVIVLASTKRKASAGEVLEYLGWHGVQATLRIFDVGSRSVGETLLDESRALQADLMLIGGYTHTRARQLLFGGVTRHVLAAADLPVMMAH